jgi:ferrous iron transport protein B
MAKRVLNKRKLTTNQIRAIETSARYQYLRNLMVLSSAVEQDLPHRVTEALDRVLLHRLFGPLIFLSIMAFVFQSIFSWAEPAMAASEGLIEWIASSVGSLMPDGLFRNLVVEGAIAGMGNVIIFLPQILLLFFFIGILEDTGYMARAAFLMDRVMAKGRTRWTRIRSTACQVSPVRFPASWPRAPSLASKDRLSHDSRRATSCRAVRVYRFTH